MSPNSERGLRPPSDASPENQVAPAKPALEHARDRFTRSEPALDGDSCGALLGLLPSGDTREGARES